MCRSYFELQVKTGQEQGEIGLHAVTCRFLCRCPKNWKESQFRRKELFRRKESAERIRTEVRINDSTADFEANYFTAACRQVTGASAELDITDFN